MLITDLNKIGDRLYAIRKRLGMTQAQVAEAAELSDRSYADIERGTSNMRVEMLVRICGVLRVTPDAILTEEDAPEIPEEELLRSLSDLPKKEKDTALRILSVFLQSTR